MVAYVNTGFANVSTTDVIAAFKIINTSLWPDSDGTLRGAETEYSCWTFQATT